MSDAARERAIERLAQTLFDADALGAQWANEGAEMQDNFRAQARSIIEAIGLVAVDPDLVERLQSPDKDTEVQARHELAAVVLEQLADKA